MNPLLRRSRGAICSHQFWIGRTHITVPHLHSIARHPWRLRRLLVQTARHSQASYDYCRRF